MINVRYVLFLLISMAVLACNPPAAPADKTPSDSVVVEKKADKWLPYNERLELEEKALRASQKVKAVKVYASTATTDGKGEYLAESKTFDRQGNLTYHITYDPKKNTLRETRNSYRNDLLMESVVDDSEGTSYRATYHYDANGNRLGELLTRPSGDTLLHRSYRYDARGNETKARMVNPERGLDLQKITVYDAQGRPNKVSEVRDSFVNWSESYVYDGPTWTTTRTSATGKVMGIFKSTFDARDHATSVKNLSAEGEVRLAIQYSYDDAGRLSVADYLTKEGKSSQRLEYAYDENGLLQQQRVILPQSPMGKVSRMEYTFY